MTKTSASGPAATVASSTWSWTTESWRCRCRWFRVRWVNRCLVTQESYQTATPIESSWTDQLQDIRTRLSNGFHCPCCVVVDDSDVSLFNGHREFRFYSGIGDGSKLCRQSCMLNSHPIRLVDFQRFGRLLQGRGLLHHRMWTCEILRSRFFPQRNGSIPPS